MSGTRAVVVVTRGWIFAGDVTREHGRIRLSNAVHVFSWTTIGFAGMLKQGRGPNVVLHAISDVDMPETSEVFSVPVHDTWGL